MTKDRAQAAFNFRVEAAELARHRDHPTHEANGDEQRYADVCYPFSFTKGLEHDPKTGLLLNASDFEDFRSAIDNGYVDAFTTSVKVPTAKPRRKWEAPTAGMVGDLQGPDCQAVTMAPAPAFPSTELCYEMAEVYELALLRDIPFTEFETGAGNGDVQDSVNRLNNLDYTTEGFPGRPRTTNASGLVDEQTVFRGSSPGVDDGPYLSQFMLIGNEARDGTAKVKDGLIEYGTIAINQRTATATPHLDYLQDKKSWLHVQDGYTATPESYTGGRRFICTPRDLATYVHYDALYEAYLNACIILLGMGTPFDPAFDNLSGGDQLYHVGAGSVDRNAGGFALWGGPHVLTLVTEVATRALKAVRYQKFNNHIRLRPEALAGRIACVKDIKHHFPCFGHELHEFAHKIDPTLKEIGKVNKAATGSTTHFLPMAFPEGSPMHPAYGAGHATVAGACVTMLKAFFDTSAVFVRPDTNSEPVFKKLRDSGMKKAAKGKNIPVEFVSKCDTYKPKSKSKPKVPGYCDGELVERKRECPLTLEGELNKLAANISIGRNMAGVHYYTDYYDSLRMGEEIAIGILKEQALGYSTDDFVLSVPTFDGPVVRIGRK
ncbi:MAG: vanadium-dependent haloperoxidase [Pseudomonadota bacterium]